ncbi:MAG: hypothetical protein LBJ74_03675 [Heliobacteriaceae bacterium]|jgi:hypothetical protein|nr:hypothetical protein [Heliobacteriaceae bacterium]
MEKKFNIDDLIDGLKFNDNQKKEFKAFNFMYYNNYQDGKLKQPYSWKLSPEYLALSPEDKKKVGVGGSILGFFFGPLSYIFSGLFGKGFLFTFLIIFVALITVLFMPEAAGDMVMRIIGFAVAAFCLMNLRRDYFYEKCLKNKLIKPYILSGQVDFSSKTDSAGR